MERVKGDREVIEITSKRGDAVLMFRADFDAEHRLEPLP